MADFLIYGANGYTGSLIARMAVERGLSPILAGRSATQVIVTANGLGLPHRIFSLDDPHAIDAGLEGIDVVLNCAGPFSQTAAAMVAGCLRRHVHYVDIAGEIAVFEALAAGDAGFRAAGILVLPGAGFDVAPTDCLAAHLKRRMPDATRLMLAFRALRHVSRGTAATAIEGLAKGTAGMVRENGKLKAVPIAAHTRTVDLGKGPALVVQVPWGDVSTAWYSTGIPNIEEYMAATPRMVSAMRAGRYLGPLLRLPFLTDFLKYSVHARTAGPTDDQRAEGSSAALGRVENNAGESAESLLRGPEGYTLTALVALWVIEKVLAGDAPPGFHTPSLAYGPDFILELPGVEREDR